MMDISMIQGSLASLKAAGEVIKVLYDAKLSTDTQAKLAELQRLIFDARQSAFDSQEELAELKNKTIELQKIIDGFDDWKVESERYKLIQPETIKAVVYGLRVDKAAGEPAHYLCANCFQQRNKSILNNGRNADGWTVMRCINCKSELTTGYRGEIIPEYVPS